MNIASVSLVAMVLIVVLILSSNFCSKFGNDVSSRVMLKARLDFLAAVDSLMILLHSVLKSPFMYSWNDCLIWLRIFLLFSFTISMILADDVLIVLKCSIYEFSSESVLTGKSCSSNVNILESRITRGTNSANNASACCRYPLLRHQSI